MSFLTPLAALAGLIAIPIILLYMLRLRRREVLVSSTFLWQQILEDKEANTPWQRLRRNLLLLLQIIILALLVIALTRPFTNVPTVSTGQTALLIDASASMNATDVGGRTRFEAAKDEALKIIDPMGPGDTMTVIRVGSVPEVLIPYTNDTNQLRAAVQNAQPGGGSADWVSALTLASSGGETADFNIVIISDGGIGDAANLPPIPGTKRYVPVGESDSNLAITALATRSLPGEMPQLFTQVTNYSSQDASVSVNFRIDGELSGSRQIGVPANSRYSFTQSLPADFTTVQATLTLPSIPDYLPVDDSAWTVSSATGTRRALLMTPGNLFVEQVLRSMPGLQTFKGDVNQGMPQQQYDLYILDGWLPPTLPDGDILFINPPNSTPLFTVGDESQNTGNLVMHSEDPLLSFVDFSSVNILKFHKITGADWARPLISVDDGPLLLAGETGGRQVAILSFAVQDSDLPLQVAWPVLIANLLEWFSPSDVVATPNDISVDDSVLLHPPFEADSVRITDPNGAVHDLSVDRQFLVYADTETPGIYKLDILKDGETIQSQLFAVNLFDENESRIAPVTGDLHLGDATAVAGEREELGQQEYWPYIALLALAFLLLEWYVHHRRLRVPPITTPVAHARTPGPV